MQRASMAEAGAASNMVEAAGGDRRRNVTEETLRIRWNYAMDGEKRLNYWEAVQETEGGETVVASTPLILEPPDPGYGKFLMTEDPAKPSVAHYEHQLKMRSERRKLVEQLMADGWHPAERDDEGLVVTMRRSTK